MATTGRPAPLTATIEDHVEEQRHLFCTCYDACLGQAARADWVSWTCERCARFKRLRRSRIQEPEGRALGRPRAGASRSRRASEPRRSLGSSHVWEEESGLVHMRLEAPSMPALFIEAARGVAEVVGGEPVAAAECADEIAVEAPSCDRLLVAWMGELLRRSLEARVRYEQFDIFYVSERRLVASVRGVRVAQARAPSRRPTYHDPSLVRVSGHVTAMPVLEV